MYYRYIFNQMYNDVNEDSIADMVDTLLWGDSPGSATRTDFRRRDRRGLGTASF